MQFLAKYNEFGLLLLRVTLGLVFVILVAPVLMGGTGAWSRFGSGIHVLGIHSHYAVWGFLGALLACIGAVLMIFGLFFRLGILFCLVIALFHALAASRNLHAGLMPIGTGLVLLSALFIGPGKYSVDKT
ncbi:MAG: DoxX family protein [Chthoniobacterales bacterium]